MTYHVLFPQAGQAIVEKGVDSRVFFRRPEDDSIYCVLSMDTIRELRRKRGRLDAYLCKQRESGVVIRIAGE